MELYLDVVAEYTRTYQENLLGTDLKKGRENIHSRRLQLKLSSYSMILIKMIIKIDFYSLGASDLASMKVSTTVES